MSDLRLHFSKEDRAYSGEQLSPHFLLRTFALRGSGIGAFIGPCDVKTEHLVDWEDRLENDHISAKRMVHFIGEFFGIPLREGVLLQRLFVSALKDSLLNELRGKNDFEIWRDGDDVFARKPRDTQPRKLTVSIVTASPVSLLLHTGVNVDPDGAPVPAIGLAELGVDPVVWIPRFLEGFAAEWDGMQWACAKVRPVI